MPTSVTELAALYRRSSFSSILSTVQLLTRRRPSTAALTALALLLTLGATASAQVTFPPPEPSDDVFVVTGPADDPDLDRYAYDKVAISVPIDRFVGEVDGDGHLVNPDDLIKEGIITPYAFVQIVAGDVDASIFQRDAVSINGATETLVGYMEGVANDFRKFTFFFDVRLLEFPSGAKDASGNLIPAVNVVYIDIDSFYNTANPNRTGTNVDWVALGFTEETARPTLLVHGWLAGGPTSPTTDTWRPLWSEGLAENEVPFYIPDLGNFRGVATGSRKIATAADALREDTGSREINIVAHSQGGIDSRRYLWNLPRGRVGTLVTIASPHGGVRTSNLLGPAHYNWEPSSWPVIGPWQRRWDAARGALGIDLSRKNMERFNKVDPVNSRTELHTLAGDLRVFGKSMSNLGFEGSVPNDGFIAVSSVFSAPSKYSGDNCLALDNSLAVAHLNQTGNEDFFSFIYDNYLLGTSFRIPTGTFSRQASPDVLVSALGNDYSVSGGVAHANRPRLRADDTATCRQRPGAPAPAPPESARGAVEAIQTTDGTARFIAAGESQTFDIVVDAAAEALFSLYGTGGTFDYTLTAPSGTVYTSSTTAPGVTYTDFEDENGGGGGVPAEKVFTVTTPEVGLWTASVTAVSVVGDDALYSVTAGLSGTATSLSADTGDDYVLGDDIDVTFALVGSPAVVEATVIAPDTTVFGLTVLDDGVAPDAVAGDGIYTGRIAGATQAGWYSVGARAVATDGSFTRTAHTLAPVARERLTAPVHTGDSGLDTNANALFDTLVVNTTVTVAAPGLYMVSADLTDGTDRIVSATEILDVGAGTHSADLRFDGAAIRAIGANGPYTVADLTIARLDVEDNHEPYPFARTASLTSGYNANQFERSPVELLGDGSYRTEDDDGDGKYDRLIITVPTIDIQYGDNYTFSLALTTKGGAPIGASGFGPFFLNASSYPGLEFTFDGDAIRAAGLDGPYVARNFLVQGDAYGGSVILGRVLETEPYAFTDFGTPSTLGGCESAGSGSWDVPSTWTSCDGGVPGAETTATVAEAHTVTLTSDVTVGGLLVASAGEVLLDGALPRTLTVTGDVTVEPAGTLSAQPPGSGSHAVTVAGALASNGRVDLTAGTALTLSGTGTAALGGAETLRAAALRVDKPGGSVQLAGPVEISKRLELASGTFDLQGHRAVLSSDSTTGATAALIRGGGTLAGGDLTMQRIFLGTPSWRLVTAPTSGTPFSSFDGPFHVQGVPWAEVRRGSANFYAFDPDTQTYLVPQQDDPFDRGRGYFLYVYIDIDGTARPYIPDSPILLEVEGAEHASSGSIAVPFNAGDPEQSYLILGNPFMAPLDWDQIGGQNGIGMTYSTYDANGTLITYQAGGVDAGAGRYIAPFQAVWVQATAPGASVDLDRAVVVGDGDPLTTGRQSPSPRPSAVTFAVRQGASPTIHARTAVVLSSDGSSGLDPRDAVFRGPADSDPVIGMWLGGDTGPRAIESRPASGEQVVDLHIAAAQAGPLELSWQGVSDLPPGWTATLVDRLTGRRVALDDASAYTFDVGSGTALSTLPTSGPPTTPTLPRQKVHAQTPEPPYAEPARFQIVIGASAIQAASVSRPVVQVQGRTAIVTWQGSEAAGDVDGYTVELAQTEAPAAWAAAAVVSRTSEDAYRVQIDDLAYGDHRVRLLRRDASGPAALSEEVLIHVGVEGTHALGAVRPNPTRDQARLDLAVSEPQRVVVEAYDLLGRRVATLFDRRVQADEGQVVTIDTQRLAAGSYVLSVRGDTFAETTRVTIVR